MVKKKQNHRYLISLYDKVDDFLSNGSNSSDDLADIVVSFCIVAEKILKIKLYNKNPILVFDLGFIKEDNIAILSLKKEKDIKTAGIEGIISRFAIVFKKDFSSGELQTLKEIYNLRNSFVHSYKSDDEIIFDTEDVINKMGTLWEGLSKIAISLFGKEEIKNKKPKKKYTQKQLEDVLEEEVRKMLGSAESNMVFDSIYGGMPLTHDYSLGANIVSSEDYLLSGERCPRCGTFFSLIHDDDKKSWSPMSFTQRLLMNRPSNLYKCKKCNLELTEKQYEIAKKITKIPNF
jgi:hypothetical protein